MQLPARLSSRWFLISFLCVLSLFLVGGVRAQQQPNRSQRKAAVDGEMLAAVPTLNSESEVSSVSAGTASLSSAPEASSSAPPLQGVHLNLWKEFFKNLSLKPEPSVSSNTLPSAAPAHLPAEGAGGGPSPRVMEEVRPLGEEAIQQQALTLENLQDQLTTLRKSYPLQTKEVRRLIVEQEKSDRLLGQRQKAQADLEEEARRAKEKGGSPRLIDQHAQRLQEEATSLEKIEKMLTAAYGRQAELTIRVEASRREIGNVMQELGRVQRRLSQRLPETKGLKSARKKQDAVQSDLEKTESARVALENQLSEFTQRLHDQFDLLKKEQMDVARMQTENAHLRQMNPSWRVAAASGSGTTNPPWRVALLQMQKTKEEQEARLKKIEVSDAILQSQVFQLRQQLKAREEEIQHLQRQLSELKAERDELSGNVAQERHASEQAQLTLAEAEQTKADLQEQVRQMHVVQLENRQEATQLKELLDSKEEDLNHLNSQWKDAFSELTQLKEDYQQSQDEMTRLKDQLGIAQRTEGEQAKEIHALRLESTHGNQRNSALMTALHQVSLIQSQLRQLQAERASLEDQLSAVQTTMERAGRKFQDRKQTLALPRSENTVETQRLQSELEMAKGEQLQAAQKRDQIQQELKEVGSRAAQLMTELQGLEQVIGKEGQAAQSQEGSAPSLTQESKVPVEAEAPVPHREFLSPRVSQVMVQRVSDRRDFLVLSVKDIPGIKEGSIMELSLEDQPVVEVEIGSIDSDGLAMAYVTHPLGDLSQIREGSLLSAQRVVKAPQPPGPEEQ